jgi:hypothetical protein
LYAHPFFCNDDEKLVLVSSHPIIQMMEQNRLRFMVSIGEEAFQNGTRTQQRLSILLLQNTKGPEEQMMLLMMQYKEFFSFWCWVNTRGKCFLLLLLPVQPLSIDNTPSTMK